MTLIPRSKRRLVTYHGICAPEPGLRSRFVPGWTELEDVEDEGSAAAAAEADAGAAALGRDADSGSAPAAFDGVMTRHRRRWWR